MPRHNRPRPGSIKERAEADIIRLRQEGHTQREVAERVGCSQSYVHSIEHRLDGDLGL
jgi:transcriptional regulator